MKMIRYVFLGIIQLLLLTTAFAGLFDQERLLLDPKAHAHYTAEQIEIQDRIIQNLLSTHKVKANSGPRVIFLSGGMGVGKTTFRNQIFEQQILSRDDFVILDFDEMRDLLPEYQKQLLMNPKKAGDLVQDQVATMMELAFTRSLKEGRSIIYDGSLRATQYYSELINELRKCHSEYSLEQIHLSVDDEVLRDRVNSRNQQEQRQVTELMAIESQSQSMETYKKLSSTLDRSIHIRNDQTIEWAELKEYKTRAENTNFKSIGVDLVVDIDKTIVMSTQDKAVTRIDDYRVLPNALEAIELAHDEGHRISFFSGGPLERNVNLLKQLKLPRSGQSLYDLAYKLLSFHQLTQTSKVYEQKLPFFDRYKKDMTRIQKNIKNVFMIEDNANVLSTEQSKQILWILSPENKKKDLLTIFKEHLQEWKTAACLSLTQSN